MLSSTITNVRSSTQRVARLEDRSPAPSTSTLQRGNRGGEVAQLQKALSGLGGKVAVDGRFGPETEQAVRAFQKSAGLDVDGVVGPRTRAALAQAGSAGIRPELAHAAPRVGSAAPEGTVPLHTLTPPPTRRENAPVSPQGAPTNRTASFDRVTDRGQRDQLVEGRITVNGHSYDFKSGGWGRGSLPPGEYKVTPNAWNTRESGMNVGGVGYKFNLSDKYDSRVGDTRTELLIHPDGGVAGTRGCVGIVGDAATQRRFREDMKAELARNGGSFTLRVGR